MNNYDVWIRDIFANLGSDQSVLILIAPHVSGDAAFLYLHNVAVRAQKNVNVFLHESNLSPSVLFESNTRFALLGISKTRRDAVLCCFDSVLKNDSVAALKEIFDSNKWNNQT